LITVFYQKLHYTVELLPDCFINGWSNNYYNYYNSMQM